MNSLMSSSIFSMSKLPDLNLPVWLNFCENEGHSQNVPKTSWAILITLILLHLINFIALSMDDLLSKYMPHLLTVGFIHAFLISLVCLAHRAYASRPWFLPFGIIKYNIYMVPGCGIFGCATLLIGTQIIQKSPLTFLLFNAALIT